MAVQRKSSDVIFDTSATTATNVVPVGTAVPGELPGEHTFKRRLDKFWRNLDVLFEYKANLTGIGNRSEKNEDFI